MAYLFDILDAASGQVVDEVWLGHLDRSYVLPAYRACPVRDCIAWCSECRRVVPAEQIRPVQEIEEILSELRLPQEQMWKRMEARHLFGPSTEESLREHIEEWTTSLEWRLMRQSPARCLRCFSTSIKHLPTDTNIITDPEIGRELQIRVHGHMSMVDHWLYDIEGIPLDVATGELARAAWKQARSPNPSSDA